MPKVEITYKAVGINEDAEWGDYDHLMATLGRFEQERCQTVGSRNA